MSTSSFQKIVRIEKRIKAASSEGLSVFHPDIRQLRGELRAYCEEALFEDYPRAQRHELEQLLWKSVFYRPIEEFRKRIKEHIISHNESLLQKTRLAFQLFLEEGRRFYEQLAVRLQQTFGHVGYTPDSAPPAHAADQDMQQGGERYGCRASVYRCLICLGDLARYHAASTESRQKDWSQCKQYYLAATRVLPNGGNAYNQLAVLATHEQDQLAATYYYLRSLHVPSPFAVARENLMTALEANRSSHAKVVSAAGRAGAEGGGSSCRRQGQLERELKIRWVRVLGMLYLRQELDCFPARLTDAMADLDDYLLSWTQGSASRPAASATVAPPLLLMLAMCIACTAHDLLAELRQGAPTSPGVPLQPSVAAVCAVTAVAELAARLAGAACRAVGQVASHVGEVAPGPAAGGGHGVPSAAPEGQGGASGPLQRVALHSKAAADVLLPPVWVLLLWMAGQVPAWARVLLPELIPEFGAAGAARAASLAPSSALQASLRGLWQQAGRLVSAAGAACRQAGAPSAALVKGRGAGGGEGGAAQRAQQVGAELASVPLGAGSLPEDAHLQCFAPLEGSVPWDEGGAPAVGAGPACDPGAGMGPLVSGELPPGLDCALLRMLRMLSAAQALASAVVTEAGGAEGFILGEDQPLGSFLAAVRSALGHSNDEGTQHAGHAAQGAQQAVDAGQGGAATMEIDEADGEVILFKPPLAARHQQEHQQQRLGASAHAHANGAQQLQQMGALEVTPHPAVTAPQPEETLAPLTCGIQPHDQQQAAPQQQQPPQPEPRSAPRRMQPHHQHPLGPPQRHAQHAQQEGPGPPTAPARSPVTAMEVQAAEGAPQPGSLPSAAAPQAPRQGEAQQGCGQQQAQQAQHVPHQDETQQGVQQGMQQGPSLLTVAPGPESFLRPAVGTDADAAAERGQAGGGAGSGGLVQGGGGAGRVPHSPPQAAGEGAGGGSLFYSLFGADAGPANGGRASAPTGTSSHTPQQAQQGQQGLWWLPGAYPQQPTGQAQAQEQQPAPALRAFLLGQAALSDVQREEEQQYSLFAGQYTGLTGQPGGAAAHGQPAQGLSPQEMEVLRGLALGQRPLGGPSPMEHVMPGRGLAQLLGQVPKSAGLAGQPLGQMPGSAEPSSMPGWDSFSQALRHVGASAPGMAWGGGCGSGLGGAGPAQPLPAASQGPPSFLAGSSAGYGLWGHTDAPQGKQ